MGRYNLNYSIGKEEFKENLDNFVRSLFAEFLGTFTLVFFGVAACTASSGEVLPIAIGFGLALSLAIVTVGQTSGAHLNPAVTIALLVVAKINLIRAIFYIMVQFVGAIIGAFVIHVLSSSNLEEGHTRLKSDFHPVKGFALELLGTMLLVLVILGSVDSKKKLEPIAPLLIGLCLTGTILFFGKFTGSSLNPARTLGTAIVAKNFEHHWIYWAAPILGGIVGSVLYVFALEEPNSHEE